MDRLGLTTPHRLFPVIVLKPYVTEWSHISFCLSRHPDRVGYVAGKNLLLRNTAADNNVTSKATGNISKNVMGTRNSGFL